MSWLNNSLNTIKGQLTNLAQEVLADTAGPGDEEYRGDELNTKTALELLTETQLQKEQLDKVCEDKDREIAALRKQINTLKGQKISSDSDNNKAAAKTEAAGDTKSLQSGEEQNVEDSWCWEPMGSESTESTGKPQPITGSGMVDVALDGAAAALDVSRLNDLVASLEQQNEELRNSLEELDAQHDLAMQDVLGHKTQLQSQLTELKQLQADRLVEHELAMARLQAQLVEDRERQRSAAQAQLELEQRVAEQSQELQRNVLELAEMQQLLEKRGADNGELIERVRQAEAEREKLKRELEELAKLVKEKKTSESSNSSSTGKHSEDEFIVVRNADALAGSSSDPDPDTEATTPPSKEKLRDKLVSLEARISELSTLNAKLQDGDLERQLASSVLNEQLSELETRLRISESEKEQLQLELQRKLQQLMLQNQELKLNAEADQETHANDLEQQLGALRAENSQLRQELDASIAQAKFRQAIAEEKQEITDLDLDLDDVGVSADNDPHKLRSLLEALLADNSEQALDRTHRLLNERWQRLDSTEQRLVDLQDQQLIAEHEKKTLEADISQYILQCDELMKNNELLLNELDKFKRNKLETIEEHHEETIAQLESQLEEAQSQLQQQQFQWLEQSRANEQQLAELRSQDEAQLKEKQQELTHLKTQTLEVEKLKLQLQQRNEEQSLLSHQLESQKEQLLLIDALKQQLSEVQAQLKQTLAAQEQQQLQSTEQVEQLESQLELIKSSQQSTSAERSEQVAQLAEQLQRKETQLAETLQQMELLRSQLDEVKAQLKQQAEKLQESEVLRSQLEEVKAQLKQQAREAGEQSELAEQLQQKETQLAETLQQIEVLKSQLVEFKSQIQQQAEKLQQSEVLKSQLDKVQAQLKQQAQEAGEQSTAALELELKPLKAQLETLNKEKLELIMAVQQKHAENTQYYAEIQRLQPLEQQLGEQLKEREKLCDQINFLKEKSDILTTNLLTEQTNQRLLQQQQVESQEQQANVQRDLERLRAHLLEIEELHTQESVELQRELDESRAKQTALQQEVSKSSTAYTSASIRANQQAETLQAQHALLLQQRDELLTKLGVLEDRELKQQAALTNLQCALEQFQNDKEHEIEMGTQRMRRELQSQLEKQTTLQSEMAALQQQLTEANQGLRAAARLSDQLEAGQQTIAVLRDEVDSLKHANLKLEQSLSNSESSQTDKIDKSLIKSLLIGYVVSGHAHDKQQVLRMISSVLDFNAQEADKVGLNKPQSSWLGSILGGSGGGSGGSSAAGTGNENLLQAFVQFLEQESQPQASAQTRPTLLSMAKQLEAAPLPDAVHSAVPATTSADAPATSAGATPMAMAMAMSSSNEQQAGATPPTPPMQRLLMSSNEFAPTRNSSSILKDILSDS
ncbi:thyroid receptor-interacting protein 11 isoform X1 [Drosophila nasuta]|uniref:thyroid receptor-interacting protein 11 isoform X1 n=2 Tax=Drosophila nasuta TaxID=42062 RepID=UPI00295EF517|nr:thyroid receptor-interacting protein 11 isoform X1 [Drosophila nasuta]